MKNNIEPHVSEVCQENIWMYRQNKPTLVARDLHKCGVPYDATYAILLARGVFKWLAARRDLIKLKNVWRRRVKACYGILTIGGMSPYETGRMRGYLKAVEECRKEVRAICHAERWTAPDYDKGAADFLKRLEKEKGTLK